MSVLSESQSVEQAALDVKHAAGKLTGRDRSRRLELKAGGASLRARTLGGRIVTGPEFRALAVKALGTSENSNLPLDGDVSLSMLDGREAKTLIAGVSDTSAGAFITNQPGGYIPQPQRRLRILDLVRLYETNVDAVEFARQTAFTSTAAAVAEATSVTTGTKPEATIAFEKVTAPVATYSTWAPVTRRGLADVAEMRDVVDGQLTYATRRALEEAAVAAMVAGAGSTQAKGADTLATATLKLLTALRTADVEPDAALLNPADYEVLRSAVTAQHTAGPPITVGDDGVERLFSIPLIVSASVPDDTAVIADMQSVGVWLRALQIYISDSHASYFTFNLVAVLAELRAAVGVLAPAGVGTVTGWD